MFEIIAETAAEVVVEVLFRIPVILYRWITGKDGERINDYKTDRKRFIQFEGMKKRILVEERDIALVKSKISETLGELAESLVIDDFQFQTTDQGTIIHAPRSISFFTFHFLIQALGRRDIVAIGLVESTRFAYSAYNDPNSVNVIGQTYMGNRFFISLVEDYSKKQFLRVNNRIKTNPAYKVRALKNELRQI
ncbi:hypothetical protein [Chryseolinea lacunae]|uniref:Uncharacterized protein n=1 Tax=Chryseolinea lacunae TaxID=2801331 RepID=A0ABS1KNE1_9BACT|nr:hypothetical protein [Chryseolinea lacunae]MBL0740743.1 hypothetical protein [Chryseolinea lacunae]